MALDDLVTTTERPVAAITLTLPPLLRAFACVGVASAPACTTGPTAKGARGMRVFGASRRGPRPGMCRAVARRNPPTVGVMHMVT